MSKKYTKTKQQIRSLKSDCNLFSHLYIASKFRDETFFAHENHPWPPSLADQGKLRLPTKKSDLRLFNDGTTPEPPTYFDVKLVDGPAVVHFLSCKQVSTFTEYSNNVFNAWVRRELQSCDRVDIIWDIYKAEIIKECTRQQRGKRIRRKVSSHAKLPRNFPDFLRDISNKKELFEFLTSNLSSCDFPTGKVVNATSGMSVSCMWVKCYLCYT